MDTEWHVMAAVMRPEVGAREFAHYPVPPEGLQAPGISALFQYVVGDATTTFAEVDALRARNLGVYYNPDADGPAALPPELATDIKAELGFVPFELEFAKPDLTLLLAAARRPQGQTAQVVSGEFVATAGGNIALCGGVTLGEGAEQRTIEITNEQLAWPQPEPEYRQWWAGVASDVVRLHGTQSATPPGIDRRPSRSGTLPGPAGPGPVAPGRPATRPFSPLAEMKRIIVARLGICSGRGSDDRQTDPRSEESYDPAGQYCRPAAFRCRREQR